jgi:hypothetical protein
MPAFDLSRFGTSLNGDAAKADEFAVGGNLMASPNLVNRPPGPELVTDREPRRLLVMPSPVTTPPPRTPANALRRPSPSQGRALELLGHAIEYLVDEHLHNGDGAAPDSEAVCILMNLNRMIFYECEVVEPFSERLRRWLGQRIAA